MPVLDQLVEKAFTITRLPGSAPDFSGTRGQIDHTGGVLTKAGQKIDEVSALRVSAAWIANTIIADEVSSLSARIVSRSDVARRPVRPRELRALWDEPNADQTLMEFRATESLSTTLWGRSYTYLGWTRRGDLAERWPVDPSRATLERLDDGGVRLKVAGQGELENRAGERPQFMHIRLFTLPGKIDSISPVEMAADLLGLSAAYDETAARLIGRGLNASAILTAGETIDRDDSEELSRRLERIHGGASNAGKIAVLGGKDLKLERLQMSMADSEFIAQRQDVFNVTMALWRVPATVAGMVDKPSTWGTGVAEFSRGLDRFTTRPIVERVQAAVQKYILRWVDADLQYRIVFDSLLSAAPKERANVQRARLMAGTTSIERVLAQNDEPPFEEDETVFTQLALATEEDRHLERLRRQAEAAAALVRAGVEEARAFSAVGLTVDGEPPAGGEE